MKMVRKSQKPSFQAQTSGLGKTSQQKAQAIGKEGRITVDKKAARGGFPLRKSKLKY